MGNEVCNLYENKLLISLIELLEKFEVYFDEWILNYSQKQQLNGEKC